MVRYIYGGLGSSQHRIAKSLQYQSYCKPNEDSERSNNRLIEKILIGIIVLQVFYLGSLVNELNNLEYPEIKVEYTKKPKTVEQKIEHYADIYDVDLDLALNIAWCESNFIEDAQNQHSTAGGVYQFIDSTFEAYCDGDKYNADDNIKCAVRILSEGGINHWNASKHCWSHLALK